MIINFRVRGISRIMRKLVQTSILIKKNILNGTTFAMGPLNLWGITTYICLHKHMLLKQSIEVFLIIIVINIQYLI